MWPRLICRGKPALLIHGELVPINFNVAATDLPRKASLLHGKTPPSAYFNVAATDLPRKVPSPLGARLQHLTSMWPRLICRGKVGLRQIQRAAKLYFNVAATDLPRKDF